MLEERHRSLNDLQLVVGLLSLQSRAAQAAEAREALAEAARRVAMLAHCRSGARGQEATLGSALRQVCDTLREHAEPRSIRVTLEMEREDYAMLPSTVRSLVLVVNELATNALKHAFAGRDSGEIMVAVQDGGDGFVHILVDDDGTPFTQSWEADHVGLGLNLVRRLPPSVGGRVEFPADGSKCFEMWIPLVRDRATA